MQNIVICDKKLQWSSNEGIKEIVFEQSIKECLELSNLSGMVIIFEPNKCEKNKALIMNLDGSVRKHILIPQIVGDFLSIYDIYYEANNLVFILATNNNYDIACLFDNDGNYIRHHFTK